MNNYTQENITRDIMLRAQQKLASLNNNNCMEKTAMSPKAMLALLAGGTALAGGGWLYGANKLYKNNLAKHENIINGLEQKLNDANKAVLDNWGKLPDGVRPYLDAGRDKLKEVLTGMGIADRGVNYLRSMGDARAAMDADIASEVNQGLGRINSLNILRDKSREAASAFNNSLTDFLNFKNNSNFKTKSVDLANFLKDLAIQKSDNLRGLMAEGAANGKAWLGAKADSLARDAGSWAGGHAVDLGADLYEGAKAKAKIFGDAAIKALFKSLRKRNIIK